MCTKPVGIPCSHLKEEIDLWLLNTAIVCEELTLFIQFCDFHMNQWILLSFPSTFHSLSQKKKPPWVCGQAAFCPASLHQCPWLCRGTKWPRSAAYLGGGWALASLCVIFTFPYQEESHKQHILHPMSNKDKDVYWINGTRTCRVINRATEMELGLPCLFPSAKNLERVCFI